MNKETIKKTLAGIGVAGLIASVSFMTIGCGSSQKKEAVQDEAQVEAEVQADSVAVAADSTAACGAAADTTAAE